MIEEVKLGTICELYSAGDKPKMFSDVKTDKCSIPVYGNGRDNEGLVGFTDKASFKCPAVTIAARGSSCGTAFYRGNPYTPIVRLISLVPKHNVDAKYLYYQIVNRHFRGFGSGQPQITIPDIVDAVIHLETDLEIQKRIANVLFTIDTKIANNNAICADLEGMAKLLYDYWFVQFDFPDKNGKPYKSSGGKMVWNDDLKREIPEGWEVGELGFKIDIERGISYSTAHLQGDGIPMINLGSFAIGGGYKDGNLKSYNGDYGENKKIRPYDLILCLTQQTSINQRKDVIGCAMLVPDIFNGDVVISQDLCKIVCTNELKYYLIQHINTPYFHKYITGYASGSNILHLDVNGIIKHKTVIPPPEILKTYEVLVKPTWERRSKCMIENQQLASLRDFLLPMLMNGQVKVGKTDE